MTTDDIRAALQAVDAALNGTATRKESLLLFDRLNDLVLQLCDETDSKKGKKTRKGTAITLQQYLEQRKQQGKEGPFDMDSAVVKYGATVGWTSTWVRLIWREFRYRHIHGTSQRKTYVDWGAAFLNCQKDDWFGYFRMDNRTGQWTLTDKGLRAMAELEAEKRQHAQQQQAVH